MDAEIFHYSLGEIAENIRKEHTNDNDNTDELQRFQWTIIYVGIFRIVIEVAQDISPGVWFNSSFSWAVILAKQGSKKRRQQREVQGTEDDCQQRQDNVRDSVFFNRLGKRQ